MNFPVTIEIIFAIVCSAIIFAMLLNKKVCLFDIFKAQFKVLMNDATKKTSVWDFFCFLIFPASLSALIVFFFGFSFVPSSAEILITVLSILFALLLGFSTVLIAYQCQKDSPEAKILTELKNQTLVSVVMAMTLCFISLVLLLILYFSNPNLWVAKTLSFFVLWFSLVSGMYLLSTIQRLFELFHPENQ